MLTFTSGGLAPQKEHCGEKKKKINHKTTRKTQPKREKELEKVLKSKHLRSRQAVKEIWEKKQGKKSRPGGGQEGKQSPRCHAQAQQYQHIPLSPFSHPASTLFMMFCYYWQGEVCVLYPAILARPCFLCFQNGSPHPLFENQCYREISTKKMVVAFWHLTIRSMLRWRKQDTSRASEGAGRRLVPAPGAPFPSSSPRGRTLHLPRSSWWEPLPRRPPKLLIFMVPPFVVALWPIMQKPNWWNVNAR